MIVHVGRKWLLYTRDGKRVLGTHKTESDARAQETAINLSKLRRRRRRMR